MLVQKIDNQQKNNPAFRGFKFILLEGVSEEVLPKVVETFKKELGQGLLQKSYTYGEKTLTQDVFIGYNPKNYKRPEGSIHEIIIATGDDTKLYTKKSHKKSMAKKEQIDKPLFALANKILKDFGLNHYYKSVENLEFTSARAGAIEKTDRGVGVYIDTLPVKLLENKQMGHEVSPHEISTRGFKRYGYFKNGDNYQYVGTRTAKNFAESE